MSNADKETKRILIVEDERNVRLMYRVALSTEGFEVDEAGNGAEALERLKSTAFDLVILDMRMPEMDGIELLRAMRDNDLVTPAVVITAFGDVPHAVEAMKCGAIDFLEKPITPESLRGMVREILKRHRPSIHEPEMDECESHLRAAKRLLNMRQFEDAKAHLRKALELNDQSADALNLTGVLSEMQHDYRRAERYYKRALRVDMGNKGAQANMRRIIELTHFGKSQEPFNLGKNQTA